MSFEQWCQENGFGDAAALSEPQRKKLLAAWKADVAPPPEPRTDPSGKKLEEIVSAARADEDRKLKITELVAQVIHANPGKNMIDVAEALGRQAIEGNWPIEKMELELLRATRQAPARTMPQVPGPMSDPSVIEAAVCVAGNLNGIEKHFGEQTLEAAHRHYKNGLGLADLVLTFARRAGYDGLSLKANLSGALRAAFAAEIKAAGSWGPSTGGGLSGVLSNIANKFLRAGFDSVDMAWRSIAAIRNVNDFKQITTYSLTGDMTYAELPPGGEIKHAQTGAETYTNQVKTYARMLGIDRRDLINDDLNALTQVPRKLGRGGALKVNDVFWTVFLNNSSFFTAGRNNVSTGAGSALSSAGLDAANAKFLNQTDPDGNPMSIAPRILLVPPALWSTAAALMSGTTLNQVPASNAAVPNQNIWAGKYTVVTSPYMSNSAYTGNSAAAWYLLGDPNDAPVVEMAFLNGKETPTVESAEADFGMLGIAMRGFHDLGSSLQEYRAGVRSN
jgi:phage major head subunit gpT-like protein